MSFSEPLEGETSIDLSAIRIRGVTNRGELNRVEAENVRKAIVRYFSTPLTRRRAPFDFNWTLRLHQQMFGQVWDWAGVIRTHNSNLGVPYYLIANELQGLLEDLHAWSSYQVDLTEQSARLHHRSVKIHPFVNGNGRWSRLLANLWLRLHKQPHVEWPEEHISGTSVIRAEYLAAIRSADEGDLIPLIDLQHRYLARLDRRA